MPIPAAKLPARPDGLVKPPTRAADDETGYGGFVLLAKLLLGIGKLVAVDDDPVFATKAFELEAAPEVLLETTEPPEKPLEPVPAVPKPDEPAEPPGKIDDKENG